MGGLREGVEFARNLIETPRDPGNDGAQHLGRASLLRLSSATSAGMTSSRVATSKAASRARSRRGRLTGAVLPTSARATRRAAPKDLASLEKLALEAAKTPGGEADRLETARLELKGRLRVAEGNYLEASTSCRRPRSSSRRSSKATSPAIRVR
jgi:hypothetical protein